MYYNHDFTIYMTSTHIFSERFIHMIMTYWHDFKLFKRNFMARKKYHFHNCEILGIDWIARNMSYSYEFLKNKYVLVPKSKFIRSVLGAPVTGVLWKAPKKVKRLIHWSSQSNLIRKSFLQVMSIKSIVNYLEILNSVAKKS